MPRQRREIPWLQTYHGRYYVFWYEAASGRTKRLSLGVDETDPMAAQARYAAFLAGGHEVFDNRGHSGLTVSQALDQYLREHVAEHVVDKKRAEDAIIHLKTWFKDTLLTDVDIPGSRAYAAARRAGIIGGGKRRKNSEGSNATIRRELVVLGAAARHAERWKRIGAKASPPTPMPSIELPPETRAEAEWLTAEELLRAVGKATGRLRDFMLIAYYTGARRASVERLTRFQVDLKNNRLNLRAPTEDTNQRRSKKRRPVVPIHPKIRPVLERLLSESTTEYVFGTPADLYRPFRQHMKTLGFPPGKSHPHVLRHSRATHLLQAGAPIYEVARLLGDTVATVERVYGHASPEYMAAAIEQAEDWI